MRAIGNILWLVLAGLWLALAFVVAGIVQCLTIIGIPFGVQSFKLAAFCVWPFGSVVIERTDASPGLGCLGNVLWFVLGGWWLALSCLVAGVLLCLTIIGIPFGIVTFRLAGLALFPFGKDIVPGGRVPPGAVVVLGVPRGGGTA